MSLNGLQAAEVIEAHQSALIEGGGWFLLKYHARDEVALLERGKGGVGEIQEAVSGYEEESPLYGFIHYRRRKVVLKYVPEGTSRLLLARLVVHFESIKERFAPYDTIFTFAEAYELSDSTLSSTCSLHTAASIKSLRDSPTPNLAGVKEEDVSESGTVRSPGSEAGTIRNSKVETNTKEDIPSSETSSPPHLDSDSISQSTMNGTSSPNENRERASSITTQGLRPRTASNTDKDLPPTPSFSSPYISEKSRSIFDQRDFGFRSSIDTRISSNSARPSTRDLNKAYDYSRPKVKVGPRPSMDSATRPDTANGGEDAIRPVASLPSGVRLPARKAVPPRPTSQQSQKKFSLQIPKIPSQGSTPAPPPVTPTNPTNPSYPLDKTPPVPKNGLYSPAKPSDAKSLKMTPEKRRLMKALEIRQKHLAAHHAAKESVDHSTERNQENGKSEDVALAASASEPSSTETAGESPPQKPRPERLEAPVPQLENHEAAKEISHDVQDSPISAPEPSDGPSTQASSITEEDIPPIHKQDESQTNVVTNSYEASPGLLEVLEEQTQGPVVAIEQSAYNSPSMVNEPPATAYPRKENIKEQENCEAPASTVQTSSTLRAEGDTTRDSFKTTSMASEASSEHTVTDKQVGPSVETVSSIEDAPAMHPTEAPDKASKSTETSTSVPLQGVPDIPKQTSDGDSGGMDAEEPESPFLIEGHSVQTSASPSVVNLLDGLSATTHNESILPAHGVEAVAPAQSHQPSLFNMVGGFGGSGESIESPLSAVREETDVIPSPIQPDAQVLHDQQSHQDITSPQISGNQEITRPQAPTQPSIVAGEHESTGGPQSPVASGTDQIMEGLSPESPSGQKTRPRTTSKTFQFPSKSRSQSHGDRPPSLDLPKDNKQTRRSSAVQLSQIPGTSAIGSQPEPTVQKEEVRSIVQPDAQPTREPPVQLSQLASIKPEEQPESHSTVLPVPEALSHASSKALKLLGFSATQPEVLPEIRSEQAAKGSSYAPLEALSGVEHAARSEVLPASKLDVEIDAEVPLGLLPERRSEGFLDVRSDVQHIDQTRPGMAGQVLSNRTIDREDEGQAGRQARRRGMVEPAKRASTPEPSEEHFLSDDSFMEELKSAKLQEAKPVSVSRSPIKPDYLRTESDSKVTGTRDSRTVSNPLFIGNSRERSISASRPSAAVSLRSFSGTIPPRPDVKTPPSTQSAQPKKFGVSSGISQRIKALEDKSSRPNSPSLPTPTTPGFTTLRKPSFHSELNGTLGRSRTSTTYPSPQGSPELREPDPLNRPLKPHGETVSVTATIIRDPFDKAPQAPHNAASPPTLNLHESPLVVEHQVVHPPKQQVMGPPQFSPLKPPRPRYSRYSSARSASSSSTEQKAEGAPHSRRGSTASKRSGRSSRNGSEVDLHRAMSDKSLNTGFTLDNIKEEKKLSRSSRLLKRMSSVTSMSRRSIAQAISPSPRAGSIMEREEAIDEKPAFLAIDMGDINIQFPDTLLWKRRHMTINEGGVLELSASKVDNSSKIIKKIYPLSQFRPPYIPDQDREELPNSIILDFHDGSSLQCACEHPSAQAQLLKILKSAHLEHQSQ